MLHEVRISSMVFCARRDVAGGAGPVVLVVPVAAVLEPVPDAVVDAPCAPPPKRDAADEVGAAA